MAPLRRVAVIGAGVVGLTSAAVAVQHEWQDDVEFTLVAEHFSPDTTGDGSAGIIMPYLLGEVPPTITREWCEKSIRFFESILKSPQASDCGVGLLTIYQLYTEREPKPPYSDLVVDWREMTDRELSLFPARYKFGFQITTYVVECRKFLPMLLKRFKNKGGKIIEKRVENIAELAGEYDIVINCPGLEANRLVPDPLVTPIRGQVIYVKAPWIRHAVLADKYYIFPHSDRVVCGGTSQSGDWNVKVDPEDRQDIWRTCTELVPSLQKAEVISEWVGLRPGRPAGPRLEKETLRTPKGDLEVIHNYGHGGSGVTVAWGCAHDALRLLRQCLLPLPLGRDGGE